MEKYYGNYLGLVVNDQDPEGRDRVQIYVPGVTNTIYDNWNNNNKNKSIGMDIGSTFTLNEEILKKLRSVLPWAEKATPLIGPGTAMYHQEGAGASSIPLPPLPSYTNNTPKNERLPIDGYPTNELTDRMYDTLINLKSAFPNVKVTSTKRNYDEETGLVTGSDGKPVNSSPSSRHNFGDAIDISVNGLSTEEKDQISRYMVSKGVNEVLEHGADNHLHFAFDPNQKNMLFSKQPYMQKIEKDFNDGKIIVGDGEYFDINIPPVGANTEPAKVDINNEPTVVTTKITPSKGTVTSYPDNPNTVSPGEGVPSGTRSTTKILSRVWLFFYGGDIQKPVFFAYSLPPNETRAHNNVNLDNNKSNFTQKDSTSNGQMETVEVPLPNFNIPLEEMNFNPRIETRIRKTEDITIPDVLPKEDITIPDVLPKKTL